MTKSGHATLDGVRQRTITDQTDGHLTNDQMALYMERIAKWLAESEVRQKEFMIKVMGIGIAFLSIELAIFGTVIALVG